MDVNSLVQTVAIYALPVLFAITLHEAAHGYVARHFGDMTAHAQGRISLNPIRHIDPIGTVIVPILILLLTRNLVAGGLLFGWAKPVPVNYSALRKPRQHMALVAAAGPVANLIMALIWALILKFSLLSSAGRFSEPLELMSQAFNGSSYIQVMVLAEVNEFLQGHRTAAKRPVELVLRTRFNPELNQALVQRLSICSLLHSK